LDGARAQVNIKYRDSTREEEFQLAYASQQVEYKHFRGEVFQIRITVTGLGMRRVRLAKLPPDVSEEIIQYVMMFMA